MGKWCSAVLLAAVLMVAMTFVIIPDPCNLFPWLPGCGEKSGGGGGGGW